MTLSPYLWRISSQRWGQLPSCDAPFSPHLRQNAGDSDIRCQLMGGVGCCWLISSRAFLGVSCAAIYAAELLLSSCLLLLGVSGRQCNSHSCSLPHPTMYQQAIIGIGEIREGRSVEPNTPRVDRAIAAPSQLCPRATALRLPPIHLLHTTNLNYSCMLGS